MQQTESQRLKFIRNELGLTQQQIADKVKLKQGSYADVERGKVKVSGSIKRVLEKEYSINIDWLESGLGDMFVDGRKLKSVFPAAPRLEAVPLRLASDPNDYDNDGSQYEELPDGTIRMRVPLIPHKAFAGYLRGFQDPEFYEELPYISIDVTKQHKGHYLAFEVKGDSMTTLEPENFRKSIFDGVKVVGRELAKHHWKYKLHINSTDAWIIVHKTEGILIKQIIDHDVEEGMITIHSLNPDKNEYPDQDLHLNDIEQIFNVVKKIDE